MRNIIVKFPINNENDVLRLRDEIRQLYMKEPNYLRGNLDQLERFLYHFLLKGLKFTVQHILLGQVFTVAIAFKNEFDEEDVRFEVYSIQNRSTVDEKMVETNLEKLSRPVAMAMTCSHMEKCHSCDKQLLSGEIHEYQAFDENLCPRNIRVVLCSDHCLGSCGREVCYIKYY